jgi:hypothetical protein
VFYPLLPGRLRVVLVARLQMITRRCGCGHRPIKCVQNDLCVGNFTYLNLYVINPDALDLSNTVPPVRHVWIRAEIMNGDEDFFSMVRESKASSGIESSPVRLDLRCFV